MVAVASEERVTGQVGWWSGEAGVRGAAWDRTRTGAGCEGKSHHGIRTRRTHGRCIKMEDCVNEETRI